MKSVNKMNNVEKAKTLHQLLPDQIPAAIETMKEIANSIVDNQEELSKDWNNIMLSLSLWTALAQDTLRVIRSYDKQLHKSAAIFSDQLFDGYNSLFANHCIQQHANRDTASRQYKAAVNLLYDYEFNTK